MIINNIHIKNFKSIEDLYLDFTQCKGLYEISGVVGAGKTTIAEAILYGLFGSVNNKTKKDVIRWGAKTCQVDIELMCKNSILKISRGIKGSSSTLDVLIDNEPIIFTNKRDAQQQLETEYYDTSRVVIESLFVISFNNFKSISSFGTKDTKDFLDKVFNLEILSIYVDRCKSKIKNLTTEERIVANNINNYVTQIETFERLKNETIIPEDSYNAAMDSRKDNNAKLLKYKESKQIKMKVITDVINTLQGDYNYQLRLKNDLQKKIQFINKEVCPTCGAKISKEHLNEFEDELKSVDTKLSELANTITAERTKLQELELKADKAINDIIEQIRKCDSVISNFERQKKQLDNYNKTIKDIKNKHKKELLVKKNIQLDIEQYTELCSILNTDARYKVMRSVVPVINSNISYFCTKLGLPYNVVFDEEFKCTINTLNKNDIPITNLSTGQNKVIDMIIILAILKVLMGGLNMNILFLDELFSNLDSELRDLMCQLLHDDICEDVLVFIISHSGVNDNYIDGRIYVERDVKSNTSSYSITKL